MQTILERSCSKHIYIVPDGLKELMSDISREVLRCQPKNIYVFIADYLDALIITRENARIAAKLVQNISEISMTTYDILKTTGLSRSDADRITGVIQKAFKRHLREKPVVYKMIDTKTEQTEEASLITEIINEAEFPAELTEDAAFIIQNAYRKYKQKREKEKELLKGMIDWRVAARSAIKLYRRTGVSNEEANRAATLIKAAYKGYYSRKMMITLGEKHAQEEKEAQADQKKTSADEDRHSEITVKSEKSVKLNYDTIISHVDIDEIAEENTKEDDSKIKKESTVSLVVEHTLQTLLTKIIDSSDSKKNPSIANSSLTPLEEETEKLVEYLSTSDMEKVIKVSVQSPDLIEALDI